MSIKNKIVILGLSVAALSVTLMAVGVWFFINEPDATPIITPTPRPPQLASLVPSRGSVILDDLGDTYNLSVQGHYSDQTTKDLEPQKVTYRSTDPEIVSVSQDGLVTATGAGAADIIIEYEDFSKSLHALVFGDIPTLPPIDPDMVGFIPGQDEVRAVLNRIIVEVNPGYDVSDANDIAAELGGEVLLSYRTFPGHVIEFDTQKGALLDVLADLDTDDRVEAAYPDIIFEQAGSPHPIDTLSLTGDRGKAYSDAGFDKAWSMMARASDLEPIIVSVVELPPNLKEEPTKPFQPFSATVGTTKTRHPELNHDRIHIPSMSRLIRQGYRFDPPSDNHAVAVAGVIAAENDGAAHKYNVSGILPSVKNLHYDLISMNSNPHFTNLSDTLRGLETLQVIEDDIDVVNMSFGNNVLPIDIIPAPVNPVKWFAPVYKIENKIKELQGITFVVAAGNDAKDAKDVSPARLSLPENNTSSNVITVGGADKDYKERWSHSNFGKPITIAAPAEDVFTLCHGSGDISPCDEANWDPATSAYHYTQTPTGWGYGYAEGTSFAAPMVTGAVALLESIDSSLEPQDIKELLVNTADKNIICTTSLTAGSSCPQDNQELWPFLRADRAVAKLLSERVDVRITDWIVHSDKTYWDIDIDIENTGEIGWTFHIKVSVKSTNGDEKEFNPKDVTIGQGMSKTVNFADYLVPKGAGCWDLEVEVWMEDPTGPAHISGSLKEITYKPDATLLRTKLIKEAHDVPSTGFSLSRPQGCASTTPTTSEDATSSEEGRIAFVSDRNGSWDIYVMNPDGSGVTQLTDLPPWGIPPWPTIPDSELTNWPLARHYQRLGRDSDHNMSELAGLKWTPDGKRIAFRSPLIDSQGNHLEMYLVNADGSSGVTEMTDDDKAWYWSPRARTTIPDFSPWVGPIPPDGGQGVLSPDGNRVAFTARAPSDIYIIDADDDSGNLIRLTFLSNRGIVVTGQPKWSPDNRHLAFNADHLRFLDENTYVVDGSYMYVVDAGTSEDTSSFWGRIFSTVMRAFFGAGLTRLTDVPASSISWSPDGGRIAFTSKGNTGRYDIYVINMDGSDKTPLAGYVGRSISWSPCNNQFGWYSEDWQRLYPGPDNYECMLEPQLSSR